MNDFVAEARQKGMSDDEIMHLLVANGWSEVQARAKVSGLTVPPPPPINGSVAMPAANQMPTHGKRPSIGALEAALQHVLLWLFTGTSSVMIGIVSAALFTDQGGSSTTLLTYVVVEAVTFVPFLALFVYYLRQQRRQPELTTGKVWSIITIVLHSIGTVGSLIGFVLVILLVHDNSSSAELAASAAIFVLDVLVVAAYSLANFVKVRSQALRHLLLMIFPAALFVVVAVFGVIALVRVGPLKADDQTSQNLVTVTKQVHKYAQTNDALPATYDTIGTLPNGVSYQKLSSYTYKLCASFRHAADGYTNYGDTIDDSYASAYDFTPSGSGKNCFTVTDQDLAQKQIQSGGPVHCDEYLTANCSGPLEQVD